MFILSLFLMHFAGAQDSLSWKKVWERDLKISERWTVDQYQNVYFYESDVVRKVDPKGKALFEQSVKKYGELRKLDVRNPLKILAFSEEQQSIFYLDNTLTVQENIVDLGNEDQVGFQLNYVTQVSTSSQMDKIWTYDQDNSKISLLSFNKAQTIQVANLSGLLDLKNIRQFFEADEKLFVLDSLNGVGIFDLYGTLIQQVKDSSIQAIAVSNNYLYLLKGNELEIINLTTQERRALSLPLTPISTFLISGQNVYLESGQKLVKFSLEIF